MRVDVLSREYPPEVYGGAGVHVAELVRALRARDDLATHVHAFGALREEDRTSSYPDLAELAHANAALRTLGVDLTIVDGCAGTDLVHSHTWYANLAGHLSALLYDVPHVVTAHSLEPLRPWKAEQLGGGYAISSWVERTSYEAAAAVIAVSAAMRDDVLASYPRIDPERVHVVHNGIDTEDWRPVADPDRVRELGVDPDRPSVVFVGRITRQKGLPLFLRACSALPPDVQIARQHQYVEAERELRFGASAAVSTRVFQMARLYASKAAADAIEDAVGTMELNSDEARDLARNAMSSYVAGALMMPYERFLADAEELRYDIDVLGRLYGASFEQIAHRLVTLRRRGAEGLPFGFLRTDRAGRLSKRFPLPGLALPASGYGCVLWPIYRAFAESGYVRQVAEFPNKARYLLLARAVTKQAPGYGVEAPTYSIMLACDVVHADRTVYARGLDLSHQPALVGPSCLLCPRQECSHRY